MSELSSALKNALERGYSMQQAKQSLLNAGYSVQEINEAELMFPRSEVYVGQPNPKQLRSDFNAAPPQLPSIQPSQQSQTKTLPQQVTSYNDAQPASSKTLWIKIIILTAILLGLIGLAVYLYLNF